MGAGFAFFVPRDQASTACGVAASKGFELVDAGQVIEGPKRVIIEPLNLSYGGDDLKIR
jgi:phosphoribosylformylglycinamidine cyclo-ligase